MKRLNIFVDETGEFGFIGDTSKLYGISFVFHEQDNNITNEIINLNERLNKIGYTNMIHMADLVTKRGDYSNFSIEKRKAIFKIITHFSRKINAKYHTIIINKKYTDNYKTLKRKIFVEINNMITHNEEYFNKFDKIVLYYDNGQEPIGKILDSIFRFFKNYNHIIDFNHTNKKLFQVADMLTFIDKYAYKNKHKMQLTKAEKYFFEEEEIRKIIIKLNKKRL